MDIEITFYNNSFDINNNSVVLFQKNVATTFEEVAIAWRVIKNCGRGWHNVFTYPMEFEVAAMDIYGNVSSQMETTNGDKWLVNIGGSGDSMQLDPNGASSPNAIDVENSLSFGAIQARILKDGKLLAAKTNIAPNQKATFEFKPTLWVGLASEVTEGQAINSAVLSSINTELSLLGITKADLVLTGGGNNPFSFTLTPTA